MSRFLPPVPELPELVEALGFSDLVDVIVSSGSTGVRKPNPQAYAIALRESGNPERAWMVGDSLDEVEGARRTGLPAILVRKNHPRWAQSTVTLDGVLGIIGTDGDEPLAASPAATVGWWSGRRPGNDSRQTLASALREGRLIRVFGCWDASSARLAGLSGFDAVWASGLGISMVHGFADASLVTMSEMLSAAAAMTMHAAIPVIADCDSGFGDVTTLLRAVAEYERLGVAGICIEDKEFPKRNSFRPDGQHLMEPTLFAAMITLAKQAVPDLTILARVEALVAGGSQRDALDRGLLYADAGADVVLIHSKAPTADEVIHFTQAWRRAGTPVPLAVIPTTYPGISAEELFRKGISVVIYANQGMRASIRAVEHVADRILADGTSQHIEDDIAPLSELFDLVDTDMVEALGERAAVLSRQFAERVTADIAAHGSAWDVRL